MKCPECGTWTIVKETRVSTGNTRSGKGRGIKADDNLVAALCLQCHYEIDQGKTLSKQERQDLWQKAHIATITALAEDWPVDVPKPMET